MSIDYLLLFLSISFLLPAGNLCPYYTRIKSVKSPSISIHSFFFIFFVKIPVNSGPDGMRHRNKLIQKSLFRQYHIFSVSARRKFGNCQTSRIIACFLYKKMYLPHSPEFPPLVHLLFILWYDDISVKSQKCDYTCTSKHFRLVDTPNIRISWDFHPSRSKMHSRSRISALSTVACLISLLLPEKWHSCTVTFPCT